jgi:hypothetical protein
VSEDKWWSRAQDEKAGKSAKEEAKALKGRRRIGRAGGKAECKQKQPHSREKLSTRKQRRRVR